MKIRKIGQMADHSEVLELVIENSGKMTANIITYGAIIKNLMVLDEDGTLKDMVLGQDTLEQYLENPGCSAAVIGRVANRIKGGHFILNKRSCQLDCNENGNCLHSGNANYAGKNFTVTGYGESWVTLCRRDNGEGGFPGSALVEITYCITEKDALKICYRFIPEEDTPVNLTNHVYFNLSGGQDADILDHEMKLNAGYYTPADRDMIPTGEILKVAETELDFTKRRGLREVLEGGRGLDHNYVLDGTGYRKAAELWYTAGNRRMEVYTDQPGVQIYTGNHFDGSRACKGGIRYGKYAGICFETQNFPNGVNYSHFPDCIVKKNTVFTSRTAYRFSQL